MQILLKRCHVCRSECHAGFVTCLSKGEADSMALLVARPYRRCCRPWWSVLASPPWLWRLSSIIIHSTHFPPSRLRSTTVLHHRRHSSDSGSLSPCSHSSKRPLRWQKVLFGHFWCSDRFITQGFDCAVPFGKRIYRCADSGIGAGHLGFKSRDMCV